MTYPEWIAVDWGTTNLRAFAIGQTGQVIAEAHSTKGMNTLSSKEFEPALMDVIEQWLEDGRTIPVYTCGMIGARQGWKEANYRSVPCHPIPDVGFTIAPTSDPRISVYILPGLSQSQPADVMRGEETQIAGLMTSNPNFSGTVCLPGTHSKWVAIEIGLVQEFRTYMTGELFALISSQSVLRHSLAEGGVNNEVFLSAARSAMHDPGGVVENLFSLRAASLLEETDPESVRAKLSGMIIGQELGLAWKFWENRDVTIIGSDSVVDLYKLALASLGVNVAIYDSRQATLDGLKHAFAPELRLQA